MSVGLKDELFLIKSKLELLEKELTDQMMHLEIEADKWAKYDEGAVKLISKEKNKIIKFDIGGEIFHTKLETILSIKDTLFYRLLLSNKLDIDKCIFIDRDPNYFNYILSFIRNKKVNLNNLNINELKCLKKDVEFYQISDLEKILEECLIQVYFVSFSVNSNYVSGNTTLGSQDVTDLNNFEDKTQTKGICASYNGWIILELNRVVEFDSIEIGGYKGNIALWAPSNGQNSTVYTSLDNVTYFEVGTVKGNYSEINKVILNKSKAKYIKFSNSTYIGIGYLKILLFDK